MALFKLKGCLAQVSTSGIIGLQPSMEKIQELICNWIAREISYQKGRSPSFCLAFTRRTAFVHPFQCKIPKVAQDLHVAVSEQV
jgi:hypothetical protein